MKVLKMFMIVAVIILASTAFAGTIKIDGIDHGVLKNMTVDQGGNVVITTNTVTPPPPPPPPAYPAPKLSANDPNMWYGEAKGIQSVSKETYFKFDIPSQCNLVTVAWTSFDWIGKIDMLVKASSLPTITDWNNAIAKGYPVQSLTAPLWYNLFHTSGGGGETITMKNVSAGTYYIMMKNTNSTSSSFKVWYTPDCQYVPR